MFELCEHGMVVMAQIVSRWASDLCQIFHTKLDGAKSLIVLRWSEARELRYQMGTNESQHSPAEARSDALGFMQKMRKKISETNHEKICYQYEYTPCLLHLSLKQTLEMREVHPQFQMQHMTGHACIDSVC